MLQVRAITVGQLGEFRPSPEEDARRFGLKLDRRPYSGTKYTLEQMAKFISDGMKSPAMKQFAEMVVRQAGVPASEHLSNKRAAQILLDYVRSNVRYRPDPDNTEAVQMAAITLCVPGAAMCIPVGDCFPEGTLLLRSDYAFVPIEQIHPGDKIWGRDKWTTVKAKAFKGKLLVDAIEMNNGSTMYLTPDHKVYSGRCKHGKSVECHTCPAVDRVGSFERISVGDLQEGETLLQPDRVSFGENQPDPDRMYVEGLALADGWVHEHPTRFHIAGRDGKRKEKQKHEVAEICKRLGIETLWHPRYITVKDPEWSARLAGLGHYARDKHLETIDLAEASAEAALRGLMADSTTNSSGTGGRTYSTTSRMLMLQVRVLHRMFGVSASYKFLTPEQHGGAGKHPLWRLGVRNPGEKRDKTLAVRSIERAVKKVPCWDIQTEDHYVYLPEHDVTVSNCDDLVVALASLMGAYGIPVKIVKQTFGADDEEEHVLVIFRTDDGDWLGADPSAPDKPVGWMASASKEVTIDPLDPKGTGNQLAEYVGIGGFGRGLGRLPPRQVLKKLGNLRDDSVALQTRLQDLSLATALAIEACGSRLTAVQQSQWSDLAQRVLQYVSSDPGTIDVAQGTILGNELVAWGDVLRTAGCTAPVPAPIPVVTPPPGGQESSSWIGLARLGLYTLMIGAGAYTLSQVTELVRVSSDVAGVRHVTQGAAEARRLVRGRRKR